jgi:uncharacterized membrane protein
MLRIASLCVLAAFGALPQPFASAQELKQQAASDAAAATHPLLTGVKSIASSGIPGPLAATREHAFVLVTGEENGMALPVVVCSQWQSGRVAAFGHGGMLGADALMQEGTAALVRNLASWLGEGRGLQGPHKAEAPADGKASRIIGVHDNAKLEEVLTAAGYSVKKVEAINSESLNGCAWVFVDAHDIKPAAMPALREFVTRKGGGLLTAGLGWGWLQLNPGKAIQEHPGNVLLADAGIAWCDGYLDTTGDRSFEIVAIDPTLHASHALRQVQTAVATKGKVEPQCGATLGSALRAVAMTDPLFVASAELLRDPNAAAIARPAISEEKPLRSKDALSRLLVSLDLDISSRTGQQVGAHPSAANFPGAVPMDAVREQGAIVRVMGGKQWESTGMYAPAGELVTFEIVGAGEAPSEQLFVQIGCHTDELWHHNAWKRMPVITKRVAWKPGEAGDTLKFTSQFGGLIYIEKRKQSKAETLVRIGGAVQAPYFRLGETSLDAWKLARQAPAPWAELASDKVIVSVPSSHVRDIEDPASLMQFWDAISDAHATLGTIDLMPPRPHRFVADVQISAGYMHSGYPIMTHLDAAAFMTSLETLKKGSWGLLHELGHNHQEGDWTFDGTGEVTCNLFALHAIDTICTPDANDRGHPGVNTPPSLEKHLALGAPFEKWKQDPFLALHMYVQLEKAFGWETFKKVFAEYRTLKQSERPKSDLEKRDQWMVRFSRACGKNLGPFFEKWGVPTSESARASIKDLDAWMPADWPEAKGE